jgi:excisionase family DNA binding protein
LPKPVLTIEETAAVFGASVKMIRRAIRDGELETVKMGRTTFVLREPLERKLKADLSAFGTARNRVRKSD